MNRAPSRLLLCTLSAAVAAAATSSAPAFPNPFKRKAPLAAPANPELQAAERAAGDLLRQAQDQEAAGKSGAAVATCKRLVERYPLTSFAPMALFRLASAYERDGKFKKAFDTYQELVDTYKQSPQFSEAIDRQIAIATQSRTEKLGSFLGIPKKLDSSEQLEMFEKVIANAPRGRRAPEAQFEIAKVHEEQDAPDLAIAAYQKVVEDYPNSPLAAEAQSKIGQGYLGKIEEGSRDASNIEKARRATDQASGLFPNTALPNLPNTRLQVDEISAENAWKTGRFYENQANYRAALVYYSDVLRAPSSAHFAEARERINAMTTKDPGLLESVPATALASQDLAVPAATDLKNKPGYFGPPAPPARVASVLRQPTMRPSRDQVPITPLEEPDLPTGSEPSRKPDDSLLNPSTPPAPGDLLPGDPLPPAGAPSPEPPALPPAGDRAALPPPSSRPPCSSPAAPATAPDPASPPASKTSAPSPSPPSATSPSNPAPPSSSPTTSSANSKSTAPIKSRTPKTPTPSSAAPSAPSPAANFAAPATTTSAPANSNSLWTSTSSSSKPQPATFFPKAISRAPPPSSSTPTSNSASARPSTTPPAKWPKN